MKLDNVTIVAVDSVSAEASLKALEMRSLLWDAIMDHTSIDHTAA